MLSKFFVTIIVCRNETKGNLRRKSRLTDKTDYCKSSQIKEEAKWNRLNQIKNVTGLRSKLSKIIVQTIENKNSFQVSFNLMWHGIKTWSYLEFIIFFEACEILFLRCFCFSQLIIISKLKSYSNRMWSVIAN